MLGEPTVTEFADYIGISQPNATYKINSLAAKGYIKKEIGNDRRECRLHMGEKFSDYYKEDMALLENAFGEISHQFTEEEIKTAEKVLLALSKQVTENIKENKISKGE